MPGDAFFRVKDLVWTLIGVALGAAIGWLIALWFYRRQRADTVRTMQQHASTRSEGARRLVRRTAIALWREVHTATGVQLSNATGELQAARAELVQTDQEPLVNQADAAIESVSSWLDDGAPDARRRDLISEIQRLIVAAGGTASSLTSMNLVL